MRWDIFCKVIDNYGDIGVAWRLSADLASRGEQVRLWVDDPSALSWMAPDGCAGLTVHRWTEPLDLAGVIPGDVLIETFGCDPDPGFVALLAGRAGSRKPQNQNTHWINLEYLTAERYAQRSHGLPSPVMSGPGAGLTKHFFYPGFDTEVGGLLRETDFLTRQAAFDRAAWLSQMPAARQAETGDKDESGERIELGSLVQNGARLISLFCYEPAVLGDWLDHLASAGPNDTPTRLLVTSGRATNAVSRWVDHKTRRQANWNQRAKLSITYLPALKQGQFDELLWACDLNFVRGEDSLVRALLAGKPFVWHLYPQADDAHIAKLEAFLDAVQAPASLRVFHRAWNGVTDAALPLIDTANLADWQVWAAQASAALHLQSSLVERLQDFVAKKR